DLVERLDVGDRVGARGASDGRLVDHHGRREQSRVFDLATSYFFDNAAELGVLFLGRCGPQPALERFIDDIVYQRGFAGPGNTGDSDHHVKRDGHIEVLQIVSACPVEPD